MTYFPVIPTGDVKLIHCRASVAGPLNSDPSCVSMKKVTCVLVYNLEALGIILEVKFLSSFLKFFKKYLYMYCTF